MVLSATCPTYLNLRPVGTTPTEDFLLSPEAERVKTIMLLQQARAVLRISKEERVYDSENSANSMKKTNTQATQTI
jgi:hypothetical protein